MGGYSSRGFHGQLLVLACANALSFLDRSFLSLVLEPVRRSFQLTDLQMGLLIGPAFLLFYSFVALPLGALADRWNRKRIILTGLWLWTLCTALFGLADAFGLLILLRMGVGLGEATLTPAAVSLISDSVPRTSLARSIGFFTAVGNLGSGLALLVGAYLLDHLATVQTWSESLAGALEPWRLVFIEISVPGVILAALGTWVLREPRDDPGCPRERARPDTSWQDALRYLTRHGRATGALIGGFSLISVGIGTTQWLPAFFERSHGWPPSLAGPYLGGAQLMGGLTGIMTGGAFADVLRDRGREDANVAIAVRGLLVALPLLVAMPFMGNPWISLILFALGNFCLMICFGVTTAAIPLVVPPPLRAKFLALYLLAGNLVGLGLTPVLVSFLTQRVFGNPQALHLSLSVVPALLLPVAIGLLLFSRVPFLRQVQALKL